MNHRALFSLVDCFCPCCFISQKIQNIIQCDTFESPTALPTIERDQIQPELFNRYFSRFCFLILNKIADCVCCLHDNPSFLEIIKLTIKTAFCYKSYDGIQSSKYRTPKPFLRFVLMKHPVLQAVRGSRRCNSLI